MRILTMDGFRPVMDGIEPYLGEWKLEVAADFAVMKSFLRSEACDCIVLDITPAECLIADFVGRIRFYSKRAGLIIISDRRSLKEKIEALTAGADDYLIKPFEISELAARILALKRRVGAVSAEDLIYKEIRINRDSKIVFVNGQELNLTKKELELLQYFIEHKNNVIPKLSLASYLSGENPDNAKGAADVIYAHVKNLKKKLIHAGCQPYLKTIYGVGYQWEGV